MNAAFAAVFSKDLAQDMAFDQVVKSHQVESGSPGNRTLNLRIKSSSLVF